MQFRILLSDQNLSRIFLSYLYFLGLLQKCFESKIFFFDFRIHWNTLMKILYLKGCKWLLSQNQWVRNDFFGYRWYEAVAKHIKLFITNIKLQRRQCLDYNVLFCSAVGSKHWWVNKNEFWAVSFSSLFRDFFRFSWFCTAELKCKCCKDNIK